MVVKVKVIVADDVTALVPLANTFLADFDAANVLDVDWGVSKIGSNDQVACFITYQE
jgi:hypothetical protein